MPSPSAREAARIERNPLRRSQLQRPQATDGACAGWSAREIGDGVLAARPLYVMRAGRVPFEQLRLLRCVFGGLIGSTIGEAGVDSLDEALATGDLAQHSNELGFLPGVQISRQLVFVLG